MFEKVDVLGAQISNATISEIVSEIISRIKNGENTVVYTPNSEIIEQFRKDENLMNLLNSADILTADGIGVVKGAKMLGTPLKERAAGYDIACQLLEEGAKEGIRLYLFGSREEVCALAKDNILKKYPGIQIVGTQNGYFKEPVGEKIARANPQVVFVCLGARKQEEWIYENKHLFSGTTFLGIGGSMDVFAGVVKRAPDIFIKLHLEWFYRLCKQPSRFVRMLALPRFLWQIILEKRRRKRLIKQNKRKGA
ncbi:MAG: WecB/TagA/CpsF family glycosyltransferase [Ruminococcaceae bacterium]|nr:WecB/TagA/CpsF family glycosyltransferase [Oscillospiraceae bacterium]